MVNLHVKSPAYVTSTCTRFPGLPMHFDQCPFILTRDLLTSCDLMQYPANMIYILAFYHSHATFSNNTPHSVSHGLGFIDRVLEKEISTHPFCWNIEISETKIVAHTAAHFIMEHLLDKCLGQENMN